MKFLHLILTILILISLSPAAFAKTLSDSESIMLAAHQDLVNSDKKLCLIYSNLEKSFNFDKNFVKLLRQDKTDYFKNRYKMRDLVLTDKPENYQGLYTIKSYMYLTELNKQKYFYLENAVKNYCYNYDYNPLGCSDVNTKNIFK